MSVARIVEQFDRCRADHRGAILPYLTAGFPDLATTELLIRECDALGAAVVELGVPYSDSIADGPVIQSSFHEAIASGFRLAKLFDLVSRVRKDVSCGLVAMVSFTIVHRTGVKRFIEQAAHCGLDGLIIPDLPLEEATPVRDVITHAGLAHIGLVAPTTDPDRRKGIAQSSSGFVYQIASAGITGERGRLDARLPVEVASLKRVSGLPVCVGFGVSSAEHVRELCSFADGAIVGSAIVRRIAEGIGAGNSREVIVSRVAEFIAELSRFDSV